MNVWGRGNAINLFLLVFLSTAFERLAHVMYGETWQRGHAHMHALHVLIIASSPFSGPGASGLQVWPQVNLSGWICGYSIYGTWRGGSPVHLQCCMLAQC